MTELGESRGKDIPNLGISQFDIFRDCTSKIQNDARDRCNSVQDDSPLEALVKERAYKQPGERWFLENLIACGIKVGVLCLLGKGSSSCCFRIRTPAVHFRRCSSPDGTVISSLQVLRGIVFACWDCIYYFSSNFWYVSLNQTHSNFSAFDSPWIVPSSFCFHSPASLAFSSVSFPPQLIPGSFSPFPVNCFPLISIPGDLLLIFPSHDRSFILNILIRLSLTLRIFVDHHSPFWSKLFKFRNKINKPIKDTSTMSKNPLDRVVTNSSCVLCKAHYFMIARFIKHLNELKAKVQSENKSKKKKLEKQKAEIEGLKEKCNHLEETISHIKTLNQSMQGEASTKNSDKKEQPPDDSVNQFW